MQAVILAAGMGKRLKSLTENNTKCMIEVNGVSLIDRMLKQIEKQDSISRIIIVVGYKGEELKDYISSLDIKTPISYIENDIYDKTNNIYSLYLAKENLCEDDTLLLESDLIFEDSVLDSLLSDERETLALVDKYESWMDGTCVKIGKDDTIEEFVPNNKFKFDEIKDYYKTVNIYKFSKDFSKHYYVPFLEAYQKALGQNEYYEQVLKVLTMLDDRQIKAKKLDNQKWYEIDDVQDLDIAKSIFNPDEDKKVDLLQKRYGGYWRYPKMIDFCYLVNPYFPPQRLKDEIKANFEELLTKYPSGMHINSLLAAKNFGVKEYNIAVGNGAAELIKSIMEMFSGKVGFARPTFEEYPNRYDNDNSVNFIPQNKDYSYTTDDLINYFEMNEVQNLIIVNPDNPSGNYIKKDDVLSLIDWAKTKGINIVIDESFVDFADEKDSSIIEQDILEQNPHLIVVKSISKSFGVPGVRLGIVASGNKELIGQIKKNVSIWNINSFGEFYLQIEEKYRNDYEESLIKIREERKRFQDELSAIKGIRVIPSQANYVMVELDDSISSKELLKLMLVKYNILMKELVSKTDGKNYLRIAVRDKHDDDILIEALKKELS